MYVLRRREEGVVGFGLDKAELVRDEGRILLSMMVSREHDSRQRTVTSARRGGGKRGRRRRDRTGRRGRTGRSRRRKGRSGRGVYDVHGADSLTADRKLGSAQEVRPKGWQGSPRQVRARSNEAGQGRPVRGSRAQDPRLDVGRRAGGEACEKERTRVGRDRACFGPAMEI